MFRCRICGRKLTTKADILAGKHEKCPGKPLPRCKLCNALYREERSSAGYAKCPHSQAQGEQHQWVPSIEEV